MSDQDNKLSSLYKESATQMPSDALDQQILAQAKAQCPTPAVNNPYSIRKYLPYSIAASVFVVTLLVTNFPQYYQQSPDFQPESSIRMNDEVPVNEIATPDITKPVASLKAIEQAPMSQPKARQRSNEVSLHRSSPQAKENSEVDLSQALLIEQISNAIAADNAQLALIELERFIKTYGIEQLPEPLQQYHQRRNENATD